MLYEFGLHDVQFPSVAPDFSPDARIICWYEGQVLARAQDIAWQIHEVSLAEDQLQYVADLNGRSYFTAQLTSLPDQAQLVSLREAPYIGETAFMLCARARALLEWRVQHRFCGQCGSPSTEVTGEFALQCQPCRLRFYPRIAPCIIVLITRGREVLLAQGERHREQGWYSTIAGFIESGESAEQAVQREVKEEVNVDVKNIHYLNSQAWPFPNQLMLGFHAEYAGGEVIPAEGEIADARWFDVDNLPKHPSSISIAGWLIRQYQHKVQASGI